ncbi:MAG: nickel pincer cofactor biosynthesis protein LarB [Hyphomicrobiales bacterium]
MKATEVNLDYGRSKRLGLEEAIYCGHKSVRQIAGIIAEASARKASLLLTRLSSGQHADLPATVRTLLDYDDVSRTAFLGETAQPVHSRIAVVAAGTSDLPVCKEAVRTLHYYGHRPSEIYDVGVAGVWRLLERVPELARMRIVIVAAGMDAALPTAVGGLVPGLVIAVPTSTGYGVSFGGQTALNSALCSCAPGVVVVNIDNGYGAASAALRVHNASVKDAGDEGE